MDKTNKITIFHSDWLKREEICQDVADLLKVQMLDIDDYILRGSVLTGDIDDMSKEAFVQKFGRGLFDTLENLSYLAYVTTVDVPYVLSLGNPRNEYITSTLCRTISVNVTEKGENGIISEISDYSIEDSTSTLDVAKKIVKAVSDDPRWSNETFMVA